MDFLFDNPLTNIPGTYFLVFYSLLTVATIIGFRIAQNRADKTKFFNIPPIPHNPDAFEIAFLRGGENELARAVVFALAQKKLVEFNNDNAKSPQVRPTNSEFDNRNLSTVERTALGWFDRTREVKDLFQADDLAAQLKPFYETYQARLEMQHFLPDEAAKSRNTRLFRQAFAIFGGLGAYKFLAAIYNGYFNVLGMIFVMIIGFIALRVAAQMPRLTALGSEYLKRLQLAFERIKPSNYNGLIEQPNAQSATFAAVDPFLLSVGVFGGAALAGTVYSDYNTAFQKAHHTSIGSSCGSGCGSCSAASGDGGSSDGGSSCGGCGGGD